jgi:hypothetical protein
MEISPLTVYGLIKMLKRLHPSAEICFDGRDIDESKFPQKKDIIENDYYYIYLK